MNDYDFGNQIYKLRKKINLSQAELADMLGITNKAVSKWETGASKPTTQMLKKLSIIFNIPIEQLLCIKNSKSKKRFSKLSLLVVLVPENQLQ